MYDIESVYRTFSCTDAAGYKTIGSETHVGPTWSTDSCQGTHAKGFQGALHSYVAVHIYQKYTGQLGPKPMWAPHGLMAVVQRKGGEHYTHIWQYTYIRKLHDGWVQTHVGPTWTTGSCHGTHAEEHWVASHSHVAVHIYQEFTEQVGLKRGTRMVHWRLLLHRCKGKSGSITRTYGSPR